MIRIKISVKIITASKVSFDKWNEVLPTCWKIFRGPNIFWPHSQNNMVLYIFVRKCMYILSIGMDTKTVVSTELPDKSDTEYFEHCHGHKKSSFDKVPETSDTASAKSFSTNSEISFQKEHPFKKLFRVRTFSAHVACSFHKPAEIFCPQFEKFPPKNRN